MPNMREIRERIKSINDIMKITNAMYLISSAKVKKAKRDLNATKPYFDASLDTMASILKNSDADKFPAFDERRDIKPEDRKKAYIVITSDKGLCGSYNHGITKIADQKLSEGGNNSLIVLGVTGRLYYQRRSNDSPDIHFEQDFAYTSPEPNIYRARTLAEFVTDKFLDGTYDEVYIIYTKMTSSTDMAPDIMRLLPLKSENFEKTKTTGKSAATAPDATFSPSVEEVMKHLEPIFLKGVIYSCTVEAFCAEQQARMTAMDNATSSAKDMLSDLSLMYNRARQAAITQEITEVCGGAQAGQQQ